MTNLANTKPDWTMMQEFHAAFRRDADRLVKAAEAREFGKPSVKVGWETFRDQLVRHHRAEDADMWPVARKNLGDKADGIKLIDEMEAEHALIDPAIEQIEAAFANPTADPEAAIEVSKSFRDNLTAHLNHEESQVLPLLDTCYSMADLKEFSAKQRKKGGIKEAAVLFPWLLDGNSETAKNAISLSPPPLRLINKYFWVRTYNKTPRW